MIRLLFVFVFVFVSFSSFADVLPIGAFGKLPVATQVTLSPDGQRVAYMGNNQGRTYVATLDLKAGEKKILIHTDNKKFKINWFVWANDQIILTSVSYPDRVRLTKFTQTRLFKTPADASKPAELVIRLKEKELLAQLQDRIIDILPDDPDHILMSVALEVDNAPSVYKINLNRPFKRQRVKRGKHHINDWMTDRQHRLRLGFARDKTKGFYRLFDLQTEKWRTIWQYEIFDEPNVVPLGFGADANELYIRADHHGRYAIFKVDLSKADLPRELVFSDPNYDVEGCLIYSNKTNDVVGVHHGEADGNKVYFDRKYQAFQASLDKAIPDAYNNIASFSADERKYILFTSSAREPGTYYLGDRDTKKLSFAIDQYPLLYRRPLSGKEKITYQTRDHLEIEAYLTLPQGEIKKNNPAIIIPHGGPMARDYDGFDWFSEFFASRGYTILQPNFRGSSGYGFEFERKSVQDWGGAMQDDLADATKWLVENYSVDGNSICILGSSYGGYAALMAAVKQQDMFQCAASIAGISDLRLVIKKSRRFTNYDVVKKQIGSDKTKLKNRSPINFAEQINIPVMMLHGDKDTVVDVEHSRKMYKAMHKHNKQVEYIELKDGNHHLGIEENRLALLASLEQFLQEHIALKSD